MNVFAPIDQSSGLAKGDLFPWISPRTSAQPTFAVDSFAGRYLVVCFYRSAGDPPGRTAVDAVLLHRDRFDDRRASFFGVSVDPLDESDGRVADSMPGLRFLWDFDEAVSRQCGAISSEPEAAYRRFWLIVDPTLHVLAVHSFDGEDSGFSQVLAQLDALPPPRLYAGFEIPAPVLLLPNVFEPDLCRLLISRFDDDGGEESGVMRGGVGVYDNRFKRRRDYVVAEPELRQACESRISRRVAPEIRKLFFMNISRMERYIVGCYSAEEGGHFQPHRDNGPGITAHRRFAVSINLNGDFEGGGVSFPEYNPTGYKAPPGWAIVFPCAILHAVAPVTRGRRYAFLPFVYDETGAKIRAAVEQAARPGLAS